MQLQGDLAAVGGDPCDSEKAQLTKHSGNAGKDFLVVAAEENIDGLDGGHMSFRC